MWERIEFLLQKQWKFKALCRSIICNDPKTNAGGFKCLWRNKKTSNLRQCAVLKIYEMVQKEQSARIFTFLLWNSERERERASIIPTKRFKRKVEETRIWKRNDGEKNQKALEMFREERFRWGLPCWNLGEPRQGDRIHAMERTGGNE